MNALSPFTSLRSAAALVLAAMALATDSAHATVHGSYSLLGDGSVKYVYLIDNVDGPFEISGWSLDLSLDAPDWNPTDSCCGGGVTVPEPGWFAGPGTPFLGEWAQDFFSWDPSSDVGIGETLGGFSFVSRFRPGEVTFHEFSAAGDHASGMTVGPFAAPVPEGEAWVVGGFTLAMLVVAGARRRLSAGAKLTR